MKYIEVISRVIITKGDQILLCKNKERGNYYLPGGHVEFGDTMVKTVYKELNEEMGLNEDNILDLKYVDILENIFGKNEITNHEIVLIFSASLTDGTEVKSTEPHIDFEWKNISELKDISFMPIEMIPIIQNYI
jgi:ADP-ribose pyrophosphatase YjhB (NUDIX family)